MADRVWDSDSDDGGPAAAAAGGGGEEEEEEEEELQKLCVFLRGAARLSPGDARAYAAAFVADGFEDVETLLLASEAQVTAVVAKPGHQLKILKALNKLRQSGRQFIWHRLAIRFVFSKKSMTPCHPATIKHHSHMRRVGLLNVF